MKSVLTACIGNICRSPMAQGFLISKLPGMSVESAGIGALVGQPAEKHAVNLMATKSIDISEHRARQINQLMCARAEIILVMDTGQRRYIEENYPLTKGKVFRIGEFAKTDVPDPYRLGLKQFENVMALLEDATHHWADRIRRI